MPRIKVKSSLSLSDAFEAFLLFLCIAYKYLLAKQHLPHAIERIRIEEQKEKRKQMMKAREKKEREII